MELNKVHSKAKKSTDSGNSLNKNKTDVKIN